MANTQSNIPSTTLRYLENSYLLKSAARILKVLPQAVGHSVILNETIFHPSGGGQPSDKGKICKEGIQFIVDKVVFDTQTGIVHHNGKFETESTFEEGDEVALEVDDDIRQMSRRNHSAGHLIAVASHLLHLPITEVKGYHFPDGPYVEFEGVLEANKNNQIIQDLQKQVNDLVGKKLPAEARLAERSALAELCSVVPAHIPENKPIRVVTIQGFKGTPCGGTHVKNIAEIGPVTIRKITQRKGQTKISYQLEAKAPIGWDN